MIEIKILKGHTELQGQILNLVEVSEMLYKCNNTGIEIIDTWNELLVLKEWAKENNTSVFFDMHIFRQTATELQFIKEIEFLSE